MAASGRDITFGHAVSAGEPPAIPASEIAAQLERIIASRGFANSERLSRFICWTVEQTLAGSSESLKQSTIATEVFDRKADFDPRIDSIVRTEAQRLRRRLAEYYESDGQADPVVISFAPGSYVPSFSKRAGEVIATPAAAAVPDRSLVAVLPFMNLSGEPDQDYLYQGITEAIIDRLAGLPGLRVTAMTSAFRFPEAEPDLTAVALKLGVGTVVQGSIRISGAQVRISARIADTHTQAWVWGRTFDCDLAGLFAVEDQISEAVAGFLKVQLSDKWRTRGKTPSIEVYNLYLQGRHAWNRLTAEGCRDAVAYFTQAIALDPEFAKPYAGLADAYNWLVFFERRRPLELMPLSKRMALRAIQLDDCCAEGYVALGTLTSIMEWQWDEGERLLRVGLDLRPSSISAHVQAVFTLLQRGRLEEARQAMQRALELDPLAVRVHRTMSIFYYHTREYESALASVERALELGPELPGTRYFLGIILMELGRNDEAIAAFEADNGDCFRGLILGSLVMAGTAAGRPHVARKAFEQLTDLAAREYVPPAGFVYAWLGRGDKERALAAVQESLETRTAGLSGLLVDPRLDSIRGEEVFQSVLRTMNLA